MPFTPLHFGPGLALKSITGRWFSLALFCFVQVLIDVEPGVNMLRGAEPIHDFLHTYAGATLAAVVALVAGKPVCQRLLRFWNTRLSPAQARWLSFPTEISWLAAATGSFAGAWSHVLLDSFMHADMRPLAPWRAENPLIFFVHVDTLYLSCAAAGAAGLAIYLWQRWRSLRGHSA